MTGHRPVATESFRANEKAALANPLWLLNM